MAFSVPPSFLQASKSRIFLCLRSSILETSLMLTFSHSLVRKNSLGSLVLPSTVSLPLASHCTCTMSSASPFFK